MFAPHLTDPRQDHCHYCALRAAYLLVYMDDAEGLPVCLEHFGYGYQLAESKNELSFLPVSISRVDERVAA